MTELENDNVGYILGENEEGDISVTKLVYDDKGNKIEEIRTGWISLEQIVEKFKAR
jgi:hypothetical protein